MTISYTFYFNQKLTKIEELLEKEQEDEGEKQQEVDDEWDEEDQDEVIFPFKLQDYDNIIAKLKYHLI